MAKQVQLRRGSNSDHSTFTGGIGELTYVSDDKTLRIHDGSTASGIKVITEGTGTTNISNDLAVNTNKMTVASATGNTVIAGTLDVTGNITGGASSVLYVPGSIVQIQYTQTDTTANYTPASSGADTEITALAVTITPKNTNSKIMIDACLNTDIALPYDGVIWVKRAISGGATTDLKATAAGSRTSGIVAVDGDTVGGHYGSVLESTNLKYFDSPSTTSATTYTIYMNVQSASDIWLNRTSTDTDNSSSERTFSYISATEIAG